MGTKLLQARKRGASKRAMESLTPNQRLFVEALLADRQFNPTSAARSAGYKTPSQAANKLMKNATVKAAIGKAIHDRAEGYKVTAKRVLDELAAIAFFNPKRLVKDSDPIPLQDLPDDVASAIQSLKVFIDPLDDGSKSIEYKPCDKLTALGLLFKHLGLGAPEQQVVTLKPDWDALYRDNRDDPNEIEGEVLKRIANDAS